MAEPSLLDRLIAFATAVGGGWMFWIGLVLTMEPYLERAAPDAWERFKTFLAKKPDRRRQVFRVFGFVALLISVFQAWDEQRAARAVAERKIAAEPPTERKKQIDHLRSPYCPMLSARRKPLLYPTFHPTPPHPV